MLPSDEECNGSPESAQLTATLACCFLLISGSAWGQEQESPAPDPLLQLEQRVERLEKLVQNQALLETASKLTRLQEDVRRLGGLVEEQKHLLQQLDKSYKNLYTDLDARLQALSENDAISRQFGLTDGPTDEAGIGDDSYSEFTEEGVETDETTEPTTLTTAAVDEPEEPATVSTAQPETTSNVTTNVGEATLLPDVEVAEKPGTDQLAMRVEYEKAFRLLNNGHYNLAVSALNQYLDKYPESPYRANARYWLAEAFFVSGRYSLAASEYEGFIADHADSSKYPQSLLKLGYSYDELGQKSKARHMLGQVISRFPDSAVSLLAKKRLERMQQP